MYKNYNVVKNADKPPGVVLGILERFCSFSRFLFSMSWSPDLFLFALVLNGLVGSIEKPGLTTVPEDVEAKDG